MAFGQGMDLYDEHDLPKAMAKFKEAADQGGPKAAGAYAWLARMQLMLRMPEDAAVSADKAIHLDKDLATAQSAVGEVLYRQGKFAEAQEIFRRIVLADKPDARAYLGLAKIHWATGNYKSAKKVIDHAFNLDSRDPEIFRRWFATLEATEQLEALKPRWALQTDPEAKQTIDLKRAIRWQEEKGKHPQGNCKLISNARTTEIRLQMLLRGPNRLGGYAIPVKFNDARATLQIDTGASGIIINARAAQKAGLQKSSALQIGGIGDEAPSSGYRAYANKITVGVLQFENCTVEVAEHLRVADEDGLIGTNIFEDFLVDLDFPNKGLRLSPLEVLPDLPPTELALHSEMPIKPNLHNRIVPDKYTNFEKVYRVGRDLLFPTRVNDSLPNLFLLDYRRLGQHDLPGFSPRNVKYFGEPRKS
jgi:tetratricopeptide (TPR) repeat protein